MQERPRADAAAVGGGLLRIKPCYAFLSRPARPYVRCSPPAVHLSRCRLRCKDRPRSGRGATGRLRQPRSRSDFDLLLARRNPRKRRGAVADQEHARSPRVLAHAPDRAASLRSAGTDRAGDRGWTRTVSGLAARTDRVSWRCRRRSCDNSPLITGAADFLRSMFPKSRLFHLLRLLLLAVSLWPVWGVAQDAAPGNGQLLQASQAFALSARIASPGVLRLHWDIAPHYYLYRGRIQVQSKDAAMHLGELDLPDGLKEHDPYLGNVEIYHGSLDARVPYSGTAANLRIAVTFQGCHEVDPKICYPPITQVLSVPLTGSQAGAIILPESDISQRGGARGFQPQMAAQSSLSSSGAESPHSTVVSPLRSALSDLPLALVLAFAGGLILNLMPCVLPVLAIKAIGLLESAESQARTRTHALAYTAGVLASFITLGLCILAMRSAGHALGWGTQLQQPLVVAVLACVL